MTVTTIISLGLMASIWLIVLSIGTRASFQEALYVFRRPGMLLRACMAIFVIVPACAIALGLFFPLSPYMKVALITLAVSPMPPVLLVKQRKTEAATDYIIGLLVAVSVVALVATPLLVYVASLLLAVPASIAPGAVARILLLSIGLPLALGMLLKRAAPSLCERAQRAAFLLGFALLIAGIILILVSSWRMIVAIVGNGSVMAIVALVSASLLAGHLLAGPGSTHARALALAAASRHPGVALAIANANFPGQRAPIVAAILLFLLVNAVVTGVYMALLRQSGGRGD